ncbi:hypothetical protein FJ656_33730, partial [Schumannella luteola]
MCTSAGSPVPSVSMRWASSRRVVRDRSALRSTFRAARRSLAIPIARPFSAPARPNHYTSRRRPGRPGGGHRYRSVAHDRSPAFRARTAARDRIGAVPATFTFGAGNARKLLRLPLYALGSLAALLVPRTPRIWVFGCGIGLGEGALPLYRAARERLGDEVRLVWMASSDAELAEARALGFDSVAKHSWRGFRLTLRARVLVVTHGFGDVNRYATGGAFVVQLWHGIPLKKLHLDSPATLKVRGIPDHRYVRALLARAYRHAGRGIDLFPVASELVAPRIASAFGVRPERIVALGDIRDDALLARGRDEVRADARRLLSAAAGDIDDASRVVLYAPTWRDGAPDPGTPTREEWELIARWLDARDAVLLVRAH